MHSTAWLIAGHARKAASVVVLSCLVAGLSLVQPLVVHRLMGQTSDLDSLPIPVLWTLASVLLGLVTAIAVKAVVQASLAEDIALEHRRGIVEDVARADADSMERSRGSDHLTGVTSDVEAVKNTVSAGALDIPAQVLLSCVALAAMVVFDPLGFLMALGAVAVLGVIAIVSGHRVSRLTRDRQEAIANATADVDALIREHRALTHRNLQGGRALAALGHFADAGRHGRGIGRVRGLMAPLNELAVSIALLLLLGVGGLRVAAGVLPLENLVTFVLYFGLLAGPAATVSNGVLAWQEGRAAAGRITERRRALAIDRRLPPLSSERWHHLDAVPLSGQLSLDRVSVPGRDPRTPRLDNVSAHFPSGGFTAVVGRSGAGKTTLLELLTRRITPSEGRVLVDGRPVEDIDLMDYRARLGIVEQEQTLLLGAGPESIAAVPGLASLVQDIRRGEDGSSNTRHSGGERQRLAIMSALTRGADLLLMDEPTSQLDGVAERNVVDLVRQRPSGTTAVVIAHRLTTVRDADQILVMDRGRIADRGTHEDLWTRCAAYRALWEEPAPQTASLTAA